jgi:hypothetical protein
MIQKQMPKPPLNCLLLGSPGRLPFLGHFRLLVKGDNCSVAITGRIGHKCAPTAAWDLAEAVQDSLRQAHGVDSQSLMRACWEQVLTLPRKELGPAQGRDLSMMMVAADADKRFLSAVGVSGIWEQSSAVVRKIAKKNTSQTNHPGIPKLPPKALHLASTNSQYFAATLDDVFANPTPKALAEAAGIQV